MAKDPAFLFYDGDAARDVSHLNRLERGCYFDLLQAQRKFGGYTVEQARKILGRDFDDCWPAIEMILSVNEGGFYHIEWVTESTKKRTEYSDIQSKRIKDYWENKKKNSSIPWNNGGNSGPIPLENEIGIVLSTIKTLTIVEEAGDEKLFVMLVLKMVEIFQRSNPKYPVDKKMDYSACLEIAYKIAESKKWEKRDVVNGRLTDCLDSWSKIVDFINKDEWLCTRSISDISSVKEWQRLVQKMDKINNKKKPPKNDSSSPPLTRL